MARFFPMADLRTLSARALQAGDYTPAASARVRAVPDTRTIRYYTTLGLIDRPAKMRGRTALYTERHVLQVVAIKRLQADDMTLSDIQQAILGADVRKLRRLAALPNGFWSAADEYLSQPKRKRDSETHDSNTSPDPPATLENDRRKDFWAQGPSPNMASSSSVVPSPSQADSEAPFNSDGIDVVNQLNLRLQPGVQLTIELPSEKVSDNVTTDWDVASLVAAATPLIDELARQGLLEQSPSLAPPSSQTSTETSS